MTDHTHTAGRLVPFVAALAVLVTSPGAAERNRNAAQELEGRAPTAEEIRPSVEAAFARESYLPGQTARLVLFNRAPGVVVSIHRVGRESAATRGNSEMRGVPVGPARRIGPSKRGRAVAIRIGDWETGLYFARLEASDGRVGFAPFVLRPRRLGEHRVAVVLPTLTWQSYNLRDDDHDGKGDSWYAAWKETRIRLGRPFLNRGVPYNFRSYDLPFLHWLARTRRSVDYLAQRDVEAAGAAMLARAYDVIIFPGHHEYVTTREYDAIEGFRDRGGNLMFLSANNFFWQVVRRGDSIVKTKRWRELGRPEAALIGVQYRANDSGGGRGPWVVRNRPASAWIFDGVELENGSELGNAGIEIDKTAPSSPKSVQVIAEIPNVFGPGLTAQMTFYGTPAGAKVFAAGAFTFAGSLRRPSVAQTMENLWERLARP